MEIKFKKLAWTLSPFYAVRWLLAFVKSMLSSNESDKRTEKLAIEALGFLSSVLITIGGLSNYTFITNICTDYYTHLLGTAYYANTIAAVGTFVLVFICVDVTMGVLARFVIKNLFTRETWTNIAGGVASLLLLGIVGLQVWASSTFSRTGNAAVVAQTYHSQAPKDHHSELIALDKSARSAKAEIIARWDKKIKDARDADDKQKKELQKQANNIMINARAESIRKYGANPQYKDNISRSAKLIAKAKKDSTNVMSKVVTTAAPLLILQNQEIDETSATFAKSRKALETAQESEFTLHSSKVTGAGLVFSQFTAWSSIAAVFVIFIIALLKLSGSSTANSSSGDGVDGQVRKIIKKLSTYITRFNDAITARPHPNLEAAHTNGIKLIDLYTELNTLSPERYKSILKKYESVKQYEIYHPQDIFSKLDELGVLS
jgi:hypothetical protein